MSQGQISCRILLKGQANTGKTAFQNSILKQPFDPSYNPTIGVDFAVTNTTLNQLKIKVQLFDLSGSERYRTINLMHYKGAHGIVIMYDITNRQSFLALGRWVEEAREGCKNAKIIIIASKSDLENKREVSEEQGRTYAWGIGVGFFEVSMKSGNNVREAFDALLLDINREEVEKAKKKAQEEELERQQEEKQKEKKEGDKVVPIAWKIGGGLCALGVIGIGAYIIRRYK